MKKFFLLNVAITLVCILFSNNMIHASWTDLSLSGRLAYDDNHGVKAEDAGPSYTQGLTLTFTLPFLNDAPMQGSIGLNENENLTSKSRAVTTQMAVRYKVFSFTFATNEDVRDEQGGGGSSAKRQNFSATFSPQEKFLPQLSYTFSESDEDLGGSSNTFSFQVNKDISPGNKFKVGLAYSISKNSDVLNESETQSQRANINASLTPINSIRFTVNKDFGLNENTTSAESQAETNRTSYTLGLNNIFRFDPLKDVNFNWNRSEDFSSGTNELTVSTSKSVAFRLTPLDKVDIAYTYSISENESATDVTTTNNDNQNLNITIPLKYNLNMAYTYSTRKTADNDGIGTTGEDNGIRLGFNSPMIEGSSIALSFTFNNDKKENTSDQDTKENETISWGVTGRAKIFHNIDLNFSHNDSITKSNDFDNDQESNNQSFGGSYGYTIMQAIKGNFSINGGSRSSNSRTDTDRSSDRSVSNGLTYSAGKINLGLNMTFSENESEDITSRKSLSPNFSYSLSEGKISMNYTLTDRVDEDPITGDLTSTRSVNYTLSYNYKIAPEATFNFSYSARNTIDFEASENNDDGDRLSAGLTFSF